MNKLRDWTKDARCKGVDSDLFFPVTKEDEEAATQFCDDCPVKAACLGYALKTNQNDGVWGGTTAEHRRRIHRAGKKVA